MSNEETPLLQSEHDIIYDRFSKKKAVPSHDCVMGRTGYMWALSSHIPWCSTGSIPVFAS